MSLKKSRTQETPYLSTDADRSTDTETNLQGFFAAKKHSTRHTAHGTQQIAKKKHFFIFFVLFHMAHGMAVISPGAAFVGAVRRVDQ